MKKRRLRKQSLEREILIPPLPTIDVWPEEEEDEGTYHYTKEEQKYIPRGSHASRWRQGMKNIRMKIKGSKLTLVIDLSREYGIPENRRNIRIASTEGPKPIPTAEYPLTFLLASVYRFPPRRRLPHLE